MPASVFEGLREVLNSPAGAALMGDGSGLSALKPILTATPSPLLLQALGPLAARLPKNLANLSPGPAATDELAQKISWAYAASKPAALAEIEARSRAAAEAVAAHPGNSALLGMMSNALDFYSLYGEDADERVALFQLQAAAARTREDAQGWARRILEGSRSSDDRAAPFHASGFQDSEVPVLLIRGCRIDEASGRVLKPETGAPLTRQEARDLQNDFRRSVSRRVLLRLAQAGDDGSAEFQKAAVELNRDSLPREVRRAVEMGRKDAQAIILRRLASSTRRWLASPTSESLPNVFPHDAEAEEKLSGMISAAIVEQLSKDSQGVRLLNQLRDERGELRLPTVRVLSLRGESIDALYASHGRQLILNLDRVRSQIFPRLPEPERAAAEKNFATTAGAIASLCENPAMIRFLVDAFQSTLFHELVHFHQDLSRPLTAAVRRGQVPIGAVLEEEYEAYYRQYLYIHSLLLGANARLDLDYIDGYRTLIGSLSRWKSRIDQSYGQFNYYVSLEELARLQSKSTTLMRRLAGEDGRRFDLGAARRNVIERLKGAKAGWSAILQERKAANEMFAQYGKPWPELAREGQRRWVELNAASGRWAEVAVAQQSLARLAESHSDRANWRIQAEISFRRALEALSNVAASSLEERLRVIALASSYVDKENEPWTDEMKAAYFRDVPLKILQLRRDAASAAERSVRDQLNEEADRFEKNLNLRRWMWCAANQGESPTSPKLKKPRRAGGDEERLHEAIDDP